MVVICEECGLKYQIDASKIIGDKARFNCKGCSFSIIVDKTKLEAEEEISSLEDALLSDESAALDDDPLAEALEEVPINESEESQSQPFESTITTEATAATTEQTTKPSGLGLTAKVVMLMLLVSLLPAGIYFGLSFKQTSDQIEADTNKSGKLVSGLLASEVDEWIDKNVRVLKAAAKLPNIKSMNQFEQETVLKALQAEYPWMYLVFTTDERGMNVSRSDGKSLKDYSNRQYVKDVSNGSDLAWQNLIGKTSKKPALVLAVPIKSGDITVGVLASAMTRDDISKLVTTYTQGQTGRSFLVDQTGKAVAHRDNAFVLQQEDMSTHPLVQASTNSGSGKVVFTDADGTEAIGFAQKTKLGWTLAVQQAKAEAFEPLKKAQLFAYSLLSVTVVVILLIAYFSSRAIVKPIRSLTDAANRISVGDLDVEISTKSKDEIGDLAAAIVRMQDSIRLSISRLSRKKRR